MSRPSITEEMVDSVYAEIVEMVVPLDPDPLLSGPRRLTAKIAETRSHLSRVERILTQWSQYSYWYKRSLRTTKSQIDLQREHMLANDPNVRAGRSLQDRMAIANQMLMDDIKELRGFESVLEDVELVMKALMSKKADLKDTQHQIRQQYRICQDEISLGGRWLHKPKDQLPDVVPMRQTVNPVSSLDALLGDIEEEGAEDFELGGALSEPEEELTPEEIESALDDLGVDEPDPEPKGSEPPPAFDVDDFLSGLPD